jgi:hypothetical protein
MTFGLPGVPRLRDGLIRSGFIFIELDDPGSFRLLARQLNQSFFFQCLLVIGRYRAAFAFAQRVARAATRVRVR